MYIYIHINKMCINANYQKITEVAYSLQMLFKKVIVGTHWISTRMKEFLWIEILWVFEDVKRYR